MTTAYSPEILTCDVAVIGAGGAGLRAALAAAEGGLAVMCLSKVPPTRSHTVAAQGGINAALGNRLPDNWEWHMYDTLRGSDWLADGDVVRHMCEQAPQAIAELEHMGMPFTRDENGTIYQRAYGGQNSDFGKGGPAYRACAVADRTGHALLHTLYGNAVRAGVQFMVECIALDLIMDDQGVCRGVLVWKLESGELFILRAHTTIIASGGFGQAWAATTASSICTGDGGGMALRAGLALQDMEFVQFHPTSLYGNGILVTEGARGEGASLLNGQNERFMERYAPKSMELASRDVIARAMATEIIEGRGCGVNKDHLLLDLRHLGKDVLQTQLPAVMEIAHTFARIDPETTPIPVVPAVHYTMGGLPANLDCAAITLDENGAEFAVPGLKVIGEAASNSVHGANRLGCNSLLDLIVFGKEAGEKCARTISPNKHHTQLSGSDIQRCYQLLDRMRHAKGEFKPSAIRKDIQKAMQAYAGIFRNAELLQQGRDTLQQLWQQFHHGLYVGDSSLLWNNNLADAYETDNLLRQAIVTIDSALARTESRGAHWREDYPQRNDEVFRHHSLAWLDYESGACHLLPRPVRRYTSPSGEECFPPETRNY